MKRFRYVGDPLCLLACTGYGLNRWLVPAAVRGWFLRGYFNDLLLIPAALPLVLWLQRRGGLRSADNRPDWREIGLHLAVWSFAAEIVAPYLFTRAVGDPWNVAAYAGGALLSGLIWQWT